MPSAMVSNNDSVNAGVRTKLLAEYLSSATIRPKLTPASITTP
ncbi:MAG: hypothetical protein ABI693_31140 [Bryobacteraceae bacterium]